MTYTGTICSPACTRSWMARSIAEMAWCLTRSMHTITSTAPTAAAASNAPIEDEVRCARHQQGVLATCRLTFAAVHDDHRPATALAHRSQLATRWERAAAAAAQAGRLDGGKCTTRSACGVEAAEADTCDDASASGIG